jgi:hypothetical protein
MKTQSRPSDLFVIAVTEFGLADAHKQLHHQGWALTFIIMGACFMLMAAVAWKVGR